MLRIIDLGRNDGQELTFQEASLISEQIVTSIKEVMYSGIFKHPTGVLANSIRSFVSGQSVYIISLQPYGDAQDQGMSPHVMWYLLGKTVPIRTYKYGTSKVIYRKVTLKSFLAGGWRHPGISPKQFIQSGLDRAMLGLPNYNYSVRTPAGISR